MLKKILLMGIIPVACIALFSLLDALGALSGVEHRLYDVALSLRPDVPEDPSLLLIDVDDEAIEKSDTTWPWPRDYMADGLLLLLEFGARAQVFDIHYEQASPAGINPDKYEGVNAKYDENFSTLTAFFSELVYQVSIGQIPVSQLTDFGNMYIEEVDRIKADLLNQIGEIAVDRDQLLGRAAAAFGNAFFIVNVLNVDKKTARPSDQALLEKAFVKNGLINGAKLSQAPDFILPIMPVLQGARHLGFPNTTLDQPDGVNRRISLFFEYNGRLIPQLGFSALLDYLGNPAVEVSPDSVLLKGAILPGKGTQADIRIPLTQDGSLLINWPKKQFVDSFGSHLSFWQLLNHDRLMADIVYNTRLLAQLQNQGVLGVMGGPVNFLETYDAPAETMRRALLAGDAGVDIEAYRRVREGFAENLVELFSEAKEAELVAGITVGSAEEAAFIEDLIHQVYAANRERLIPQFRQIRALLQKELPGSICFTSWTSTSTTDIGVTPFDGEYANVGMHAAIVNTVLSGQFLDDTPWWVTLVTTALLTLLVYTLVSFIKNPLFSVLAGGGAILAVTFGLILIFILTGVYLNLLSPFVSAFLVFIGFTVINFLRTAKEKTFIRNAFSHYLSKEVISELIADPSKLNLGGEFKPLTALFTDIKGFSTLSEILDPPALVHLLNGYLTEMSNIILDLSGTIDKYIGDAIVSFFNAPIALPRHAYNACLAAVRMKKVEKLMNDHLLAEKLSPKPLWTRIGINTGEMVVGNMGTQRKLNYTIMGHHVNLAARLEGVNKQYGTYTLISENTLKEAGDAFLVRRLDRVRVVGINTPVRIYELIDEKAAAPKDMTDFVDFFHQGLDAFEARDWDKAKNLFKEALGARSDDGPSDAFLKRAVHNKKNPPPDNWDGVFNLATK